MHDFHLANKILNLILEEGEKNNLKKIIEIKIELGEIIEHNQCVTPANLKFNINILAKGTIAENAKIKINSIKNESFMLKEITGSNG
ncbi:hydrogenase maturation nickel metallochaperone HypA [Candidatus Kuenenbacteria bacterium]|nr:hydrogenase maturation nickel metallochaperone HypA [Candidatus Kuenenbacteria bacterium]